MFIRKIFPVIAAQVRSHNSLLFFGLVACLALVPCLAQADFAYPDFGSLAGLELNGTAMQSGIYG